MTTPPIVPAEPAIPGHDLPDLRDEKAWPADRLHALAIAARAEEDRRQTLANASADFDRLNRQVLGASGRSEGEEWVRPTSAVDAYPQGWRVAHKGAPFESLIPANTTEPGFDPRWWKSLAPEADTGPQPWKQPTAGLPRGEGGPYGEGDKVVLDGATYMSLADNNVREPGVVGTETLWKKV